MSDTAREAIQARSELELTSKAYEEIHEETMKAVFEDAETPEQAWALILEYRACTKAIARLVSKLQTKQMDDHYEQQEEDHG